MKKLIWFAIILLTSEISAQSIEKEIHKLASAISSVRERTIEKLAQKATAEQLADHMENMNWKIRAGIARILGKIGGNTSVEKLSELIQDDDNRVRLVAIEALGHTKHNNAVDLLISILAENNRKVRSKAKRALEIFQNNVSYNTVRESSANFLLESLENANLELIAISSKLLSRIKELEEVNEKLLALLKNGDYQVTRYYALQALLDRKDYDFVKEFQKFDLHNKISIANLLRFSFSLKAQKLIRYLVLAKNPSLRIAAIETLECWQNTWSKQILVNLIYDKSPQVKARALEAIGNIKESKALDQVIKSLKDREVSVRMAAAIALEKITDEGCIHKLIELFTNSKDPFTREIASKILAKIGDSRTTKVFLDSLRDLNSRIRLNAAIALGKSRTTKVIESLGKALEEENQEIKKAVADSLGKIGNAKAKEILLKQLKNKPCVSVIWALGKWKIVEAIPLLIQFLQASSPEIRAEAAKALGRMKDQRALHPLIQSLKERHPDAKAAIVDSLSQFKKTVVLEALLKNYKDSHVATANLALALARTGSIRVIPALVKATTRENPFIVRHSAVLALAKMQPKEAIVYLIQSLNDSKLEIRLASMKALAKIGGKQAIQPLMRFLNQKYGLKTRQEAILALQYVGDERMIKHLFFLLKDENLHLQAINCAYQLINRIKDHRYLKYLLAGIQESKIRMRAACRGKRYIEFAQMSLRLDDEKLRRLIIKIIEKLKIKEMQDSLIALYPCSEIRTKIKIAETLLVMKDHRYVEDLFRYAESGSSDYNIIAAKALSNATDRKIRVRLLERIDNASIVAGTFRIFIREGMKNSEEKLLKALKLYGTEEMYAIYTMSGNEKLIQGAKEWGEKRHYNRFIKKKLTQQYIHSHVTWGR